MKIKHDHECSCGITPEKVDLARRRLLAGVAGAAAAGAVVSAGGEALAATEEARAQYADPDKPGLPQIDMEIVPGRTALVVTDPQIDFLSEDGVTWGVVGESVTEQGTVDNIERLFKAAKAAGMPVFISPHYYYPHDHEWQFEGTLEKTMHSIGMFDRLSPLSLENFEGSGADWMPQYKKYIEDGKTIVCSPHKVYSPAQNDLNLQMRKRGIDKVILA
ncbi:isochorismatase family protein, partial [Roseibium sp.]|uniref:isochorismatase family protein n=1 Tax=Roseibium sp. TaxID=1936156 RepID=UPI003D0DFDC8